jgi:transposase
MTPERDNLRDQLVKGQLVIDVQKKVAALLGLLSTDNKHGST